MKEPLLLEEEFCPLKDLIRNCTKCPELVQFRNKLREKRGGYYLPLPGVGDINARLVLVGYAPSIQGSGFTGRMFTGDRSGAFLFSLLTATGFSIPHGNIHALHDVFITAVLRCPIPSTPSQSWIKNCLPYLQRELHALPSKKIIVALGHVAWDALKMIYGFSEKFRPFQIIRISKTLRAGCLYHPSPRNTNTGKLKWDEALSFMQRVKNILESID